ncbi:D-glycero-beta-D-manno-heptose 1-phosphate adenylyltransferase [Micromonospora cathayae]|uniref:D-glycero-beta-D-manno-heptose 1-phosphate adenylyltransferase n=1 Tax=Micromonospora cathayae TaxID=3028804 RepID=A0ABY7ZVK3_9ACTN|nr:D-glycero-beta-D-manno-heptose 1-phosphate adenylyltransferase [Micromonospora sp. HUAS 3]WDZ86426.1 D-glycero-beta-D-manno-heptose 1-phosphate adenylyltransferase [Micromonospora sp. HUAS 3]
MAGAAAEQRRLATVVESWRARPVLVIGDAMLDEWRFADSDRLCREAPAPVLTLRRRISAAGGAANTAVNLAALGGLAALVAPVGADVAGDELHDCLDRAGVWDRTVNQPGRHTPVKRRMLAGNQILLREDSGEPDDVLTDDGVARLITAVECAIEELRAASGGSVPTLVVCDYGLGALSAPIRAWLVANRHRFATVALDAHDLADWRGLAPTVVTPSFAEATRLLARANAAAAHPAGAADVALHPDPPDGPSELVVGTAPGAARTARGGERTHADVPPATGPTGEPTPGEERMSLTGDGLSITGTGVTIAATDGPRTANGGGPHRAAGPNGPSAPDDAEQTSTDRVLLAQARLAELREHTGADVVAVTLDTEGAVVGGAEGESRRSRATPVPASHAVGAGDAYLAAMTLALAAEAPLPTAAQLAQLAATITVSDTGTCVCRRQDLLAALGVDAAGAGRTVVVTPDDLAAIVAEHRDAGRSVVFTNGCFDVLHPGHVRYLQQAAELGDLLIVAVNSDDSVRRLKGPDRPVNPVEDRSALLAALSCVDHVVVFEEDSPAVLIETVRPDVYVKGGDYPPEMVPEAPLVRRLGGQVRTLGYVPDRSTSAIIERIRAQQVSTGEPAPNGNGDREPYPNGNGDREPYPNGNGDRGTLTGRTP